MNEQNFQPQNYSYDIQDHQVDNSLMYDSDYSPEVRDEMQGDNFNGYMPNDGHYEYNTMQFDEYNELKPSPGYQPDDLQEFQHGGYQEYSPNDIESFQQHLSAGEFNQYQQNISPATFSPNGRPFYQDNLMEVPTISTGFQPTMGPSFPAHDQRNIGPSLDQPSSVSSSDLSYGNQLSPGRKPSNVAGDAPSSVNGILEMEGSVEPNGPILGGHGYIPAQTMQKAYYELGETPEIKAACLRGFRQQIDIHQEDNNFDEHSDAFLLKFLRSRKFDVEAAYALLEKYYNVRENKPEVFRNLTRKNVKRTMEQGIVGVLPQRDKKGRVIMTFNFNKWNMSLPFHFEKLLRVFVYTLEKLFESEETQINGVVIISNLSQLGVLQTKSLGAPMIEKIIGIFEGNFPFRLSAIHLLNPPWHFKLLWKMVDPLTKIKQKTARRIFIHDGDLSRFKAEFDADILPKELGGKCPAYDNSLWVKEILEPEQATKPQQQNLKKTLQHPSTPKMKRSPTPSRKSMK